MIVAICTQLKTGRIKNVFRYGQPFGTKKAYIIVRREKDALDRGYIFRIIVHMSPGQDLLLDDYCDNDISILLDGFKGNDRFGNYNALETIQEFIDIVVDNDDGTISRERRFLLPSRIF